MWSCNFQKVTKLGSIRAGEYSSINLNARSLTLESIYLSTLLCSLLISEGCLSVHNGGPAMVLVCVKVDR